jgi:aromatic-amino-acid transaminase
VQHLIADCAARPGDDPIFSLNAEAQRRAKAGDSVINATLGALMEDDGTLAVMPSVFETLRAVAPVQAAGYAPIAGVPRFLQAVTRDLFGEYGLADACVAASTPGGTGALHHALVNFLEPGQALLTTSYYWGPYQTLADHTRRKLETFEMFDARGAFHVAAFEQALLAQMARQQRALVFLNTPCHNPTGYSLDEREWRGVRDAVAQASARGPVTLLVDYAYARFAAPTSFAWQQLAGEIAEHALLLVAWTASKSHAQYGARVGALVALSPDPNERERIRQALSYSCRGTWSNCNHLGQLALAELLENPVLRARADAERGRLRALLDERVVVFNREAAAHGLRYPRYEGGFFVTVFTNDVPKAHAALRARGIFCVPLAGALRVALCSTPSRDVPRLCRELAEATR